MAAMQRSVPRLTLTKAWLAGTPKLATRVHWQCTSAPTPALESCKKSSSLRAVSVPLAQSKRWAHNLNAVKADKLADLQDTSILTEPEVMPRNQVNFTQRCFVTCPNPRIYFWDFGFLRGRRVRVLGGTISENFKGSVLFLCHEARKWNLCVCM